MQNRSDSTTFTLPSGAQIFLEDPDGKLRGCFCQLFGSTEAGVAVIAEQVIKKHNLAQQRAKNGTGI